MSAQLEQVKAYVMQNMPVEATGHDWHHAFRVHRHAKTIAEREGGDLDIIEVAALLHDIDDWKFSDSLDNGASLAERFLALIGFGQSLILPVCEIIQSISFKGAGESNAMVTLEGCIVQDADRLDALGAIGLARTFAYGGFKGQPIYDPIIPVTLHKNFKDYRNHKGTTINHFYEKLLLIKDKLHTPTARVLAEQKHRVLEQYLECFFKEWQSIPWPETATV